MKTAKPDIIELVQSVARFLAQEAGPQLSGSTAFNARIAGNVLSMIERELAQGETLAAAETARLQQLLNRDGDRETLTLELIQQIRDDKLDLSSDALLEHLYATTMGRLSIDNPRYASYKKVLSQVKT